MSSDVRSGGFLNSSPQALARTVGGFYLVNIITSLIAFSGKGSHALIVASGLLATACYVTVTVLLYFLFRPVNRAVSFIAALFSLAGCAAGILSGRHLLPIQIHPLVFFGCYCVLMAMAGLGWLTFLSHQLATRLTPYHYIMGGIGEGLFTLWLLVMGVNAPAWKQRATARLAELTHP